MRLPRLGDLLVFIPFGFAAACASGSETERQFANDPDSGDEGSAGYSGSSGSSGSSGTGGGTGGIAGSGGSGIAGEAGQGGGPVVPTDFGQPCTGPAECESGHCVEGPDGDLCSAPCDGSCPDDYDCVTIEGLNPPDDHLCMPRATWLCRPCSVDADCAREGVVDDPSRCLSWGDDGSFCTVPCDGDCPDDYACEVNGTESLCVPAMDQTCTCKPAWAESGYETACARANSHGSCPGTRGCTASGLSSCDAEAPAAEVCDGEDNDCDLATDEDSCDDGLGCTVDSCHGTTCSNEIAAGSCLIEGVCHGTGAFNPLDPCELCNPGAAQASWSVHTGGCDDGDSCTTGDQCSNGICSGNPIEDGYESNDAVSAPFGLSSASDCDDFPSGTASATLYGPGDEDWFSYHVSDDWLCSIYPAARLTVPTGMNYDLCVYVTCDDNSTPSVSCTSGAVDSANGMGGCCSRNGGSSQEYVRLDHDCNATDDTGMLWVRVFNAGSTYTCEPYTLEHGDN